MKTEININDTISFELTKEGLDILENHYFKLYEHLDHNSRKETAKTFAKSKRFDGKHNMQIWEFMQIFGKHIHMGMNFAITKGNCFEI